ncbi:MAG: hypothetical protein M0R47_20715 [Methylobacter sp.]|jgi:hypothetical protein|uniref:hypothetical protein n=1 Tax=Methylobacter sp. TaxID=2051955 RepID=UPI002601473F|nr:hypothetical protein [Methylobacter sp.]MCK9622945.1 hypothetical protein [Methylobacter sp.]
MNSITDVELKHLLRFVGYGRLDAKVWFIGMEEGGNERNIEDNIRSRLKFSHVEDCAEAHTIFLKESKFHTGKRVIQRTWRGMCYIMLSLEGGDTKPESIRNYQAERLGHSRSSGQTLLCELMPLPNPSMKKWCYGELIRRFQTRDEYYKTVKPFRIRLLRKLLRMYLPKVVICYGKGYWADYRRMFPEFNFSKSKCGQFEVAEEKGQVVVLTPHFTARSMNGKFDDVVAIVEPVYKKCAKV